MQATYPTRTALKSSRNGQMKKTRIGKDHRAGPLARVPRSVTRVLITDEQCNADAERSSDELLMNSLNRLSYGQRRHSSVG